MSNTIKTNELTPEMDSQLKGKASTGKETQITHVEANPEDGSNSRISTAAGTRLSLFRDDLAYVWNNRPKFFFKAKRAVYNRVYQSAKRRLQDHLIDRMVSYLASSDTTALDEEITSGALKTLYKGLGGAAGASTLGSVIGPTAGAVTGSVVAGVAMRKTGAHDYLQEKVKDYTRDLRLAIISGNQDGIREALKNLAHPEAMVGTKKTCIDSDSELPSNRPDKDALLEEHFNAMVQDAVFTALSTYMHVRMHAFIVEATEANTGIIGFNSQILGTMSWLIFIRDPEKIQNALEYHALGYKVSSKKRRANAVSLMNTFYGEESSSLDCGVHHIQKKEPKTSFNLGMEYIQTKGVMNIAGEAYQAAAQKAYQTAEKVNTLANSKSDLTQEKKGFFVKTGIYFSTVGTSVYTYITTSRPCLFITYPFCQVGAYFKSSLNARVNREINSRIDSFIEQKQEALLESLLSKECNFTDELLANGAANGIMNLVVYPQFENYFLAETIARITPIEKYSLELITKALTPAVYQLRQKLVDVDPKSTVLDSADQSSATREAVIEELVTAYQESMIMEGVEIALEEALPQLVAKMVEDQADAFGVQGFALEVTSRMIVTKLKPVLLKALEKRMFQKQVPSKERLENGKQILAKIDNCRVEDISPFNIVMEHKKAQVTKKAKETLNTAYEMALGLFSSAKARVEALMQDEDVDPQVYDQAVKTLQEAEIKTKDVLAKAQKKVEEELEPYSIPAQTIIFETVEKGQKLIESGQELIGQITAKKVAKVARMTTVTGVMVFAEYVIKPLNNMLLDFGFGHAGQEQLTY